MTDFGITTIDTLYGGRPRTTAAFLLEEGDRACFVETNTNRAVPRLLDALEARGKTPEQVDYVIITHVHLDHAGGAARLMEACPNATLLAHPRAARHVIDPSKLVASATAVYGEERFEELYGEIGPLDEGRVRVIEDGESVHLGGRELSFFYTRGHAKHHFCVYDAGSNGVFTGDSFGLIYPDLQAHGRFAFPSSSPTGFEPGQAHASLDRILDTGAERVFVTHFGEYTDLEAIADMLHRQLDLYEALFEEAYGSDLEGEALEAFCDERVRGIFDAELAGRPIDTDETRALLELDTGLNGSGLAFAVQKRRYKASQA